jgi:hypothetical protein
MKRIVVDFDTLDSEPIDLVKITEVGSERAGELPLSRLVDGRLENQIIAHRQGHAPARMQEHPTSLLPAWCE